jgi:hypothetical protein
MTAADGIDPNRWIFYRDRSEWKDVTPIKQDDDNVPVIKIAYSEKCNFHHVACAILPFLCLIDSSC